MKVHPPTRFLALLLGLGLGLPAWATEPEEEVTEELPDWMEAELEDARAWQMQAEGRLAFGSEIPPPEEVMRGSRTAAPPASAAPVETARPPEDVTFEDFREALKPYGKWVHTPEYGLVFVPSPSIQRDGWRPYLYGQWVWTLYGWTWVSEEPFGWATYHYGRWGYRVGLGWFWVPGYVWGPAWVVWRYGPDVIGWAPLYPGYVRVTAAYPVHVEHWIFVSHAHFCGHPIHLHWHRHHHDRHFHHTHWAHHWRSKGRVYAGPPRSWVARHGHVHEARIVHVHRPSPSRLVAVGGGRELRIYRPSAARPADPARIRAARPTAGSGLQRGSPAMREPVRVDRRTAKAPERPAVAPGRPPASAAKPSARNVVAPPRREATRPVEPRHQPSRVERSGRSRTKELQPRISPVERQPSPPPRAASSRGPAVERSASRALDREAPPSRSSGFFAPARLPALDRKASPSRSVSASRGVAPRLPPARTAKRPAARSVKMPTARSFQMPVARASSARSAARIAAGRIEAGRRR